MSLNLVAHPIALLMFAFLIPLFYCLRWKKEELRNIFSLTFCSFLMILLYPKILNFFSKWEAIGYFISKFILFVILPMITIFYIESWGLREVLSKVGLRKENIKKSVLYGLGAAVITILITIFASSTTFQVDLLWRVVMFFEAFTEEFFFRGVLFLYLAQKTNLKVAYLTSIIGFVLIHPQHFNHLFLVSTIAQAVLLTIVADKTENIIGPWIAHGLNRTVPSLIRIMFGI